MISFNRFPEPPSSINLIITTIFIVRTVLTFDMFFSTNRMSFCVIKWSYDNKAIKTENMIRVINYKALSVKKEFNAIRNSEFLY